VTILDATDDLSILQHNLFNDDSMSNPTPAVSNGQLFLRSMRAS
jgi:hypothetical protein